MPIVSGKGPQSQSQIPPDQKLQHAKKAKHGKRLLSPLKKFARKLLELDKHKTPHKTSIFDRKAKVPDLWIKNAAEDYRERQDYESIKPTEIAIPEMEKPEIKEKHTESKKPERLTVNFSSKVKKGDLWIPNAPEAHRARLEMAENDFTNIPLENQIAEPTPTNPPETAPTFSTFKSNNASQTSRKSAETATLATKIKTDKKPPVKPSTPPPPPPPPSQSAKPKPDSAAGQS
ncbi:hypothetical protein [uncultured Endozoicomonas sp.]|uniref:hypothetical protein n=1 Tax=uncultured Endozoicomonas sp. TaxID=432652 RepID=UPI00260C968B|nr:hypothetical protein [uncultured Endozoicomonas sp.]